jgi:hypothetical protein
VTGIPRSGTAVHGCPEGLLSTTEASGSNSLDDLTLEEQEDDDARASASLFNEVSTDQAKGTSQVAPRIASISGPQFWTHSRGFRQVCAFV